jgi:hypothetical protein
MEEIAKTIHIDSFDLETKRRLRRLGVPIFSHFRFEWALSTSARVGEFMHCIAKLLDAKRMVLRMLIMT